jgi:hypothetical protein
MKGPMKKNVFFPPLLLLLLAVPAYRVTAQSSGTGTNVSSAFNTSGFPQWAKDIRRWEIVAFGSFPFAMFATTFFVDTWRWADNAGLNFSEEGRRYAPWPFKSAGAVEMSNREYETTVLIAAGLSITIAFTDLIIVQIKRHKARKRAESMPPGTAIIIKKPWPEQDGSGGGVSEDAGGETGAPGFSAP